MPLNGYRSKGFTWQSSVSRRSGCQLLVKFLDLFIAENYAKLHAELRYHAENLQEQRAAKAAKKVH